MSESNSDRYNDRKINTQLSEELFNIASGFIRDLNTVMSETGYKFKLAGSIAAKKSVYKNLEGNDYVNDIDISLNRNDQQVIGFNEAKAIIYDPYVVDTIKTFLATHYSEFLIYNKLQYGLVEVDIIYSTDPLQAMSVNRFTNLTAH